MKERYKRQTEHSDEWSVSSELAKRNKRLICLILVIILLWIVSIPLTVGITSGNFSYLYGESVINNNVPDKEQGDGMRKFFNDEWELFITNCGFTDSELEVVALIRRGWYEEDIAAEICASRSTVKRRKKSIATKIARYLTYAS